MKKSIVIAGMKVEYNTREELADIMAVMGVNAPASGKKGTGKKAQPKMTEAEKAAKAEETEAKRLAYKVDKRSRNCLTKAENKLVAAWMRENKRNPGDKEDWEKAKAEWIAAHPLA